MLITSCKASCQLSVTVTWYGSYDINHGNMLAIQMTFYTKSDLFLKFRNWTIWRSNYFRSDRKYPTFIGLRTCILFVRCRSFWPILDGQMIRFPKNLVTLVVRFCIRRSKMTHSQIWNDFDNYSCSTCSMRSGDFDQGVFCFWL